MTEHMVKKLGLQLGQKYMTKSENEVVIHNMADDLFTYKKYRKANAYEMIDILRYALMRVGEFVDEAEIESVVMFHWNEL